MKVSFHLILLMLFLALVLCMRQMEPLFHTLFPDIKAPIYTRTTFLDLTLSHIILVAASTGAALMTGLAAAVFVTRSFGREFEPLLRAITRIGQTFPPVAVLAVCVPVLGYGAGPVFVALWLYGLLPVVDSTMAGFAAVPRDVLESANAMGLTPTQRLISVEFPLALPLILSGARTSAVINTGTAAIGSTVGAVTLGSPIIEGLSAANPAYVLQGALIVGLLALLIDGAFDCVENALEQRRSKSRVALRLP